MELSIYEQIVELRKETENSKRGYVFEQLVREIQPWDRKPPIVVSPKNEQLDGVYTWKGITFLIESKAKKGLIKAGSHDWEDFALKMRDREGKGVIGIFCSLFEVHQDVYSKGENLNRRGGNVIILAGKIWEELMEEQLMFKDFLDYMILFTRIKYISKPPKVKQIKRWCYEKKETEKRLSDYSQKKSSRFLRRYKHNFHEKLYVPRLFDNKLKEFTRLLRPNLLKDGKKKDSPKQIAIIRDFSGTGKTTLSIELSLASEHFFSVGFSAKDQEIDVAVDKFFDDFADNYGLEELLAVNKPIVFIFDSLDEAEYEFAKKKREIISLQKKIEELNLFAGQRKLRAFPIAVFFTVREAYWRRWESIFEGRDNLIQYKSRISSFSEKEFEVAVKNYSSTYHYSLVKPISSRSKKILSLPINLEVFSKANEYEGKITIGEIWEGKILSSYFQRKEEDISKHHIFGLTVNSFNRILISLAYQVLENNKNSFTRNQFFQLIDRNFGNLIDQKEEILQKLSSEQIIVQDIEHKSHFRFTYNRFIDYLMAKYLIFEVKETKNFLLLGKITEIIFNSAFISMFKVFSNLRSICEEEYPQLAKELKAYYGNSNLFLKRLLPKLRSDIAFGGKTTFEHLQLIIESSYTEAPEFTREIFFVISAKNNGRRKQEIIDCFELAWRTNENHPERWKLFVKMAHLGFLLEEKVIDSIFESNSYKEWEVFLGLAIENRITDNFREILSEIPDEQITLIPNLGAEWANANKLLQIIIENKEFIPGESLHEVNSPLKGENRIVKDEPALPSISNEESQRVNSLVKVFEELASGASNIGANFNPFSIDSLSNEAILVLNAKIRPITFGKHGVEKKPFLNYLISEASNESHAKASQYLIEKDTIKIDLFAQDSKGLTLFQEIIYSPLPYYKSHFFIQLFKRGYSLNRNDDRFFKLSFTKAKMDKQTQSDLEALLHGWMYYNFGNVPKHESLYEIERVIYTIFSLKLHRIVGSKYKYMIQVVNNALTHYDEFAQLILNAISYYGHYEGLLKKASFAKKESVLREKFPVQITDFDGYFQMIFPELFEKQKSQ